jgi:hypothetical protein
VLLERAEDGADQRALRRPPLEHDQPPLAARAEELQVDALRDDPVVPGEPHRRHLGRLLARREQYVEPREQPAPLGLARRVAEAFGRQERRDRQRLSVAEREIREAREPGLEPVDDVEPSEGEREREVRAGADRDAHPAAPRDRHGRPDRDDLGVEPVQQRTPARGEVARAIRRGDDRDGVAECPQLTGDAVDMLVDVVRLGQGERRHEADAKAHPLRV